MFAGKPSIAIPRGFDAHPTLEEMAQKRNYGGRPPLPSDAVRSQRVVTFLTADENERLVKMAADQGKSVSLACHDLLVTGLGMCSNGAD